MNANAEPDRALELSRGLLKSLGHSVKLLSLYNLAHPVPASSQQESWHLLHELFSATGWPELSLSLSAGRWLVNGRVAADSARAYELLAIAFRAHALQSVSFRPECRLYELSAFCELASTPPNRAYRTDAADFMKERGVRHITVNIEEFVRMHKAGAAASALVQSPQAASAMRLPAKPPPAPPPPAPPAAGAAEAEAAAPAGSSSAPDAKKPQGFGSFIKSLVEKTVSDPAERAQIYAEALRHVEQALARHSSEATHRLLLEKQGIVNERVRAESVLTTVAQGKVIVDQEGRVLMMDSAAEEIVGRPFADVAGKKITEGVDGEEQFVVLSKELVLPENRPITAGMESAGGRDAMSAFRQSVAVVHDEKGRVVGTYAVLPHAAKFRETQRLQEEFVANVTHDLKAPLTAVYSALEVLVARLGDRLEQEDGELLDICVRNSRTLRQMIDELLDFSKLRSGRMTVHPERLVLEPVLSECARALMPWARSKRVSLECAAGAADAQVPAVAAVLADRSRLLQVLNNLVSNAIKFTPEGGRVRLWARPGGAERPAHVVVSVSDTGCGVAPEDRKRIFERFTQGQSGRREGVGLGLTIVRELVEQHRGELWLESEPGRGATFSFSLPMVAERGP